MSRGSQVRGHRRTAASKTPSRQLCHSQSAPPGSPAGPGAAQRHHSGEAVQEPGQAGAPLPGEGQGGGDGGGAEFQSPRNLVPGNPESEQETHPSRMSLRLKREWITQQGHTALPLRHAQLLQRRLQGGEESTHRLPLYKGMYFGHGFMNIRVFSS